MSKIQSARRVEKPWGYELWFAHSDTYAGKMIYVNAGERLSLQYHEYKEEHSMLVSGRMKLIYGDSLEHLHEVEIHPGDCWHNPPGAIHTVEALEDSAFVEASTPELDDVVRLEDRYGRKGTSAI